MNWPTIQEISAMTPLPEGYRYEQMRPADIGPLIETLRQGFPGLSAGSEACYFTEQFYLDEVMIDDETERDVFVLLIKKGDEIAAMGSWEREEHSMTLYARVGVIATAHRGARMAVLAMELGRRSSVGLFARSAFARGR